MTIRNDQPSLGFILLEKTGLLKHILPELTALKGIDEVEGQRHKDNFYHTLEVEIIFQNTPMMFGYVGQPYSMILAKRQQKSLAKKLDGRFMVMNLRDLKWYTTYLKD